MEIIINFRNKSKEVLRMEIFYTDEIEVPHKGDVVDMGDNIHYGIVSATTHALGRKPPQIWVWVDKNV